MAVLELDEFDELAFLGFKELGMNELNRTWDLSVLVSVKLFSVIPKSRERYKFQNYIF